MDCVSDDATMTNDPKGCIGGGTYRTAAYPDEQRRRPSPLGPADTLRSAPINLMVEREVQCGSAQQLPVASNIFPVTNPTGKSSTDSRASFSIRKHNRLHHSLNVL